MTLGFDNPLPLMFARAFAQSGAAAAAWTGMWYGLAIGAMNAAGSGPAPQVAQVANKPAAEDEIAAPAVKPRLPAVAAAAAAARVAKPPSRKSGAHRK